MRVTQQIRRKSSFACLVLFAACALQAADIHVRNFAQVDSHVLRGGQPQESDIRDLAADHVSLIINLREPDVVEEAERRTAESLGVKYVNVPFRPMSAPTPAEMKQVLALMTNDESGKIFVHCLRGKDRTGTVIACYRIQHDGWSPERALAEARRMGMSHTEFGMRSFILHFHPVDLTGTALAAR